MIWTFDTLKAKGLPNYAFYYGDVLKAEKTGDRKVLFTFRDNTNKELPLILGQLPVLPSKWWANRDFEKVSLEIPLGSGAYKVDSFDVGRSIAYRRVDDWWAKDLWMNRGRNNFEVMRYEYYRDVTVQFEAFKAGEIDIRQENIARNWATAYDIPPVRDGRIQRAEIPHELPTGMQCFAFNTRRDFFKDRRVREAIATMFDFAWTNKNLFYGMYKRNISFFGNSELASSGLPTPAELKYLEPLRGKIPEEVFTKEFKLPESDGTGNVRDLARRALALLKEAGWEVKDGKMTETKTGKKLAFEMLLNDASFERVVLPYKQNLERIGVDMNVRTIDTAQFKRRDDEFDFDMMVDGLRPVAVAGQRAARLLGLQGGRHAGQPQRHRHQRRRHRQPDRDADRRARPREPDQRHPRARPRAAVEPLRGAQLAQQHRLRRLLEPLRPAGQGREIRARRLRHLVDRRGQGQGPAARRRKEVIEREARSHPERAARDL